MAELDLVVKNVQVVRPNKDTVDPMDLGIKDGKFAKMEKEIKPEEANEVYDAKGKLGFPGVIEPHAHVGIYKKVNEDAPAEFGAAADPDRRDPYTYGPPPPGFTHEPRGTGPSCGAGRPGDVGCTRW